MQKSLFGKMSDGTPVDLYTLTSAGGVVCKILNYGGIVTEIQVPDRNGKTTDVVLGFDDLQSYRERSRYYGAIVGRVANRIAKGRFTLDGKTYTLAINNGPNHLHGGLRGFDKVIWHAEPFTRPRAVGLRLTYTSPDGEEGYPGNLKTACTYTLNDENELRSDIEATTDRPTPVNLTNHTYWNLAGKGEVLDQELTIAADHYTPTDDTLIPTGEIAPVKGTPQDFTSPRPIGSRFGEIAKKPPGYDHNFVLNSGGKELAFCARARDPKSGRALEVWTDQPGVQLYTANYETPITKAKRGEEYKGYCAICLETQNFPDYLNHPNFPQGILRPGEIYRHTTIWKFKTE